jgi:GxxExxY protein
MYELQKKGLEVHAQVGFPVYYEEEKLDLGFRIDLLVENKVIVELKSVESLTGVHFKQVQTYLKLTDIKLGLLINFNSMPLRESIHRIVNNL